MSDERHQVVITADGEMLEADNPTTALEAPDTSPEAGRDGQVRVVQADGSWKWEDPPVERGAVDTPLPEDAHTAHPSRPAEPVGQGEAGSSEPPDKGDTPPRPADLVRYSEQPLNPAHMSLGDIGKVGRVFASSGMFKDARDGAQAIVKIMAAQELGLGPFAGMKGFDIIEGKPEMSAGLIAALVKRSGKYDYGVQRCDADGCELDWFENGELSGTSSFTMADAKRAKLVKPNSGWEKYPSDMLFARAISQGARRYAPDIFVGSIYATGELDG